MPSSTTVPLTTTTQPAGQIVVVPELAAATIDGVLTNGEWDGAATFEMSDATPIRLMQNDGTLYLSVEGTELGSVNVVMALDDEIWILHSSAALGSALYESGPDEWELVHGFNWCCRDGGDTAGRLALLEEEASPWAGALVAVSSVRSDEHNGFWPADLSNEARLQLIGAPQPTRAFNTPEWALLQTADT
jgi:hypothetical protein